jgi:calcineurin-like phosphoesterase
MAGMVGVVDSIVGYSKMAFVRKVCLGDEHGVNVAQRKKYFQFFCVVV